MHKIATFGEIMMRLNPEGYGRFVQATKFEASYAGGEANVAVSLAQFGNDATFITKVPAHEIGQCAVNALRQFGVNTEHIVRGGPRLGVYYTEKGASQRGSKVIYDRANSSIALARREEFEWKELLKGIEWFHWTGITPALSDELVEILTDALKQCKEYGITVSCDLNYRSKLWPREKACEVMTTLMKYVDVLIANEEDAKDVFGIEASGSDVYSGKIDHMGYVEVAQKLVERFGFKSVAITLRGSISASENRWAGLLYSAGEVFESREYLIRLVDRAGGGDSFGAGLIHAMTNHWYGQKCIEFAVAASCLKQTIEHDFNLVSEQEVLNLVGGNASGRVQR